MTKDFLAFLNHIEGLEVSTRESMILIHLFKQHNVKYGYAYPTYKNIGQATKTKSDKTIESTIKKLEKSGLVKVDRSNKNNRYYIVGIEQFLIDSKAKKVAKVVKKTIEKVEEVATEIVEEVKEVVEIVVEEIKPFIPSQKFNNANVIEESVEVVDAPEVEEIDPMVKSLMNHAKAEEIIGGTHKDYEYLLKRYDISDIRLGIGFAVANAKENGKAYFSKIKTYLEKLDKERDSFVPIW